MEQYESRQMLANSAPGGTDAFVTTLEDTAYPVRVADFGFIDPTDFDNFIAVKITALPNNGELTLGGVLATPGMFVPVADVTGGSLKFLPFPSMSGSPYASFTFQVEDDGSTANGGANLDPSPNTISINVLSVNDPPAGKDGSVSYIYGGGGGVTLKPSSFVFTDLGDFPENSLGGVKITTLPKGGVLADNGITVIAGQLIPLADIAGGRLHYQPIVAGSPFQIQDGFTFQLQDDGGTGNSGIDLDPIPKSMSLIGYSFIGDPPIAAPDVAVTLFEDQRYTFTPSDFDFTSPRDGSSVTSVTIATLPSLGALFYMGFPVPVGMTIAAPDIQSGRMQFLPPADRNGSPLASFGASVQDTAGSSGYPYQIGFNVTAVNDAPSGTNSTISTPEDSTYTVSLSDFGFSDLRDSSPNNFYTVKITAAATAGLLTCGGVPVKAGDVVLANDIAAGKLKFTPAANVNGSAYASFMYRVQDDGGAANGGIDTSLTPNTIKFNVTPVNDPPVGLAGATSKTLQILSSLGGFTSAHVFTRTDFGYTDPGEKQNPNNLLSVKITVGLPQGLGSLTYLGAPVAIPATISAADIDAGKFTFIAPTIPGIGSFSFQVQDDGGTANGGVDTDPTVRTMWFRVGQPVNQAPSGTNGAVSVIEDVPYSFNVADFGFVDVDNNFFAVKILKLPDVGLLTDYMVPVAVNQFVPVADILLGKLQYLAPANANGDSVSSLLFQVQDDGDIATGGQNIDASPNTLTINVTPVNDPPVGLNRAVATFEDATYAFKASDFGYSDPNDYSANAIAAIIVNSLPSGGTLRLDNSTLTTVPASVSIGSIGQLTFTPDFNKNDGNQPPPAFTFRLKDNGGTANGGIDTSITPNTISFSVSSVNDAPSAFNGSVTTLEDTAYVFTTSDFGFFDPSDSPSNQLMAVILQSLPASGVLRFAGNALDASMLPYSIFADKLSQLTFTPDSNANELNQAKPFITFQVKDDGTTANGGIDMSLVPSTLAISVTSVNDPPQGLDRTILISCGFNGTPLSIVDFGYSDPNDSPSNDPLGVTIFFPVPLRGTLANGGSPVTSGQFISFDDLMSGKLVYTPRDGIPDSLRFQVQDSGGTSSGGIDLDPVVHTLQPWFVHGPGLQPFGADHSITILEDKSYLFQLGDFGFNDPLDAPPNNFNAVRISTLPLVGTLLANGNPVKAGDFVSVFDIAMRRFAFVPPGNLNGLPITSFRFQVQDDGDCGGNSLSPTTHTMTINVTPVNDSPTGIDRTVALACPYPYVFSLTDFPFSDSNDSPADTLRAVKVTSVFVVGSLTNNGVPVSWGQLVPVSDIAAGKFQFQPSANVFGPDNRFSFQIQDNGGTANGGVDLEPTRHWMSIAFTAKPFIAPEGTDLKVTTLEDKPYVFRTADFPIAIGNAGDQLVAVRVATLPTAGAVSLNGVPVVVGQSVSVANIAAGLLSFSAPANAAGGAVATFTFQVQDNSGICGSADLDPTPNTITIKVTPVNDPPTGASRFFDNLGCIDSTFAFSLSDFEFSDVVDSPANDFAGVIIVSLPSVGNGVLAVDGVPVVTGQFVSSTDIKFRSFTFTRPTYYAGASSRFQTSFMFLVKDDGGTTDGGIDVDSQPKTMTLDGRFVPPSLPDKEISLHPNLPLTLSPADFGIQDPNRVATDVVLVTRGPEIGTLWDNGVQINSEFINIDDLVAHTVSYVPPIDASGQALASLRFIIPNGLPDGIGICEGTPGRIIFNVNLPNHAPSFIQGADQSVADLSGPRTVIGWAKGISPGPRDEAGQNVLFSVNSNNPALFAVQPTVDGNGKLSFEPKVGASGKAEVSVVAVDDGGTANGGIDRSETHTFTIEVTLFKPLHNRVIAEDVTGDGKVVGEDALDVINYINAFGSGPINTSKGAVRVQTLAAASQPTVLYYDVTGDDYIAAEDVIAVINYINAHPIADQEFEAPMPHTSTNGITMDDSLLRILAVDSTAQSKRRKI